MRKCRQCKAPQGDHAHCTDCGARMFYTAQTPQDCPHPFDEGDAHCSSCGEHRTVALRIKLPWFKRLMAMIFG